jgi:hypothetical protein
LDDPNKSRIAKELLTAEKTEEFYLYATSDPVLCYTYFIKFILDKENDGVNEIPLVFSDKNKELARRLKEYRNLFKIREDLHDDSTQASTN